MKTLFKNDKNLYKANLHCHTIVSDGRYSPEEIKASYVKEGYNIVAFTDHRVLQSHSHLSDENFLALNALEVDINQQVTSGAAKTYHFNLYAASPDIAVTPPPPTMNYRDAAAINQYIAERNTEGFLVCYNHPRWSLQTFEEYSRLKGCFAMEIYNHNCEVADGLCGYNPYVYDEMLRYGEYSKNTNLFCLSTDDNHDQIDRFGGFIQISSPSLKYEDVINSLKMGNFYSVNCSHELKIHEISLDGDELTVRCSPCHTIAVYTNGRRCYVQPGENDGIAKFQISSKTDGYIRVMCRDEKGNDANSNAYWL